MRNSTYTSYVLNWAISQAKYGAPWGFSGRFEDGSFSMKTKDEDLSQPTSKNEDVKNPNIWLAEEWRLSIATFVEDDDCIFKTVEDWRFEDTS